MAAPGLGYTRNYTTATGVDEATQTLVTSMAGVKGCSIAAPAPGTIIVTRTYRPGWAITLAVLTSVLFLVGLLFLLITRTEALTITVAPGERRRVRISIAGTGAVDLIGRLNAGLRSLSDLRETDGTPAEVSDPTTAQALGYGAAALASSPADGADVTTPPTVTELVPVATPPVQAVTEAMPAPTARRALASATTRACSGCGVALSTDDRFCGRCGVPVPAADSTCDACGVLLFDGDPFCTGCGRAVVAA